VGLQVQVAVDAAELCAGLDQAGGALGWVPVALGLAELAHAV